MSEIDRVPEPEIDWVSDLRQVEAEFSEMVPIFGAEGGIVYAATGAGGLALITDEGGLADLLDPEEDAGLVNALVGIRRFADSDERFTYARQRGWLAALPPEQWHSACARAVDDTAKSLAAPARLYPLEAEVESTFAAALGEHLRFHTISRQQAISLESWATQPGRVDVVARRLDQTEAAFELKIEELGQCLHDLYKLLAVRPQVASYLIAAATERRFESDLEGSGLFADADPRVWLTTELLRDSAGWRSLMKRSSGRPRTLPAAVEIRLVHRASINNASGFELRAISATPIGTDRVACAQDGNLA